jgi:hypothetical protein
MKLYAEVGSVRVRQIAADAAVAGWTVLWAWAGVTVAGLVARLGAPGEAIGRAGRDFAGRLRDAASAARDLPVVGDALRSSFEAAARAGVGLARAGAEQADVVGTLAVWLGALLAAIPILLILLRHLPERVRWMQEASAARGLRATSADLELLAMRAIATRPLAELRRATRDPAGAFASGDFEPLAALELRSLGLRTEGAHPPAPSGGEGS